ncbi:peroxisomal membrane protein 11C-like [Plodia interpunctella]|uniref:peroxisomal membrane protein 11C-like n=1 Tax=Plodia interpunctella TaxID=58824 RepID=UPI0023679535|nr:peroxisomal membrane protein 11C-like [Plodia interpunctella]
MSAVVNEFCDLLQSHANRDKVVSLASYILKLWGSSAQCKELLAASARLAGARATLRLFDDATALKTLLAYGWGQQDGPLWGTLGVAGSVFNLSYLQAEKVVWLIDVGVLVVSKEFDYTARTAHKVFWSLSAFVGLIRSIRALHASALAVKSARTKCAGARYRQACFTSSKALLDVVHAVSWLPRGWLWGGRLSAEKASTVAITSAVLALIIHYHGKRLAPAKTK